MCLKLIKEEPSLKTFRFRKIKLASLNKTILIPKLNSVSSISTCYNSNLSIGNILPKKLEIKINKFNDTRNLNTLSKINTNRKKIELNLVNNKSHNNIFQNKYNIRNLSPIAINNKRIYFNSSSYREFNSLSQSKSTNNGNISLLTPLHAENVLYKSKNENNPININLEESKIKIENKQKENIKLNTIFKKDNNNIIIGMPNKTKPRTKIIIKSNILKKEYIRKNKKFYLKQKNKNFLQSILSQNNKEIIEEIDKMRRNKTKYISILSKQIKEKNVKIGDNKKSKLLNYLISLKKEIFKKDKIFNEISMNISTIININLNKLFVEANINGSMIQYLFLKYDIHKYLPSYLGISYIKENLKIPLDIKKYLIRNDILLPDVENNINSLIIQGKEEVKSNPIKKFSVIYKNELKRNTQLNSKNILSRFSLLGNSAFFTNSKNINKTKENNNNRRKSFFIRNMYTNINRRKSLPMKQILKKEDFLRLKSLIESKKENQFVYELHKLINIYDINSSDKNGNTLLSYACMNNEIYIVNYLLNNGANPNCINKYKNTPLHYALSNKNYAIADLLIQNKAKDNLKNIFGLTPW